MDILVLTFRNYERWKESEELELQCIATRKKAIGQKHSDYRKTDEHDGQPKNVDVGRLLHQLVGNASTDFIRLPREYCWKLQMTILRDLFR
jgi:hypothetical protein